MNNLDQNYNADLLDAMADMAYEEEQAMRESNEDDWSLVDRTNGIVSVDLLNDNVNLFEDIIYDDETNWSHNGWHNYCHPCNRFNPNYWTNLMLHPITQEIAATFGYQPFDEEEGQQQFQAECDFQDAPKGSIPCTGNVYRNKSGVLRCFWIPAGGNYSAEEKDELTGWYDIPSNEDIEEWAFDSICFTPADDEVEPDHPDSWLSILGLI